MHAMQAAGILVTPFKAIAWSAGEALELLEQTPPPPLGRHDVDDIVKTLRELKELAGWESMEPLAATCTLLRYQWYLWECYSVEPVSDYDGMPEFLRRCVHFACGPDGYALVHYLKTFGIKVDTLPEEAWAKDLITAAMETGGKGERRDGGREQGGGGAAQMAP
ncbi:hypothetical protein E2562_025751 [Oryza meyeriana var. granulata]|uniref:Uncharacterized protein n=1 Tax=Oryza meyeriana var. granulata TaxID=110450 RepID=A0A6G1CRQ9_9ORYZ|nr:hypothetical protein E2562_025751 [Oryza meyeriana var. granulata]